MIFPRFVNPQGESMNPKGPNGETPKEQIPETPKVEPEGTRQQIFGLEASA
jgi:hypothetical protein